MTRSIVIRVLYWWRGCLTQGRHYITSSSYRGPLVAFFWPLAVPFLHSASRNCGNIRTKSSELHGQKSSQVIKLFAAPGTVCVGRPPAPCSERTTDRRSEGGTAAGADVAPNCSSRHAETIPLDRFKASTIGVTARLNQLQNQSAPFFLPTESILLKMDSGSFWF